MLSLITMEVTFMQHYFLAWKLILNFSGSSSREAFWMFMLVHTLIAIGCITLDIAMNITIWLDDIYEVIAFVPMLSIIARRLHDIDKSGYWGLVFFIPAVGPFWLLYLLVQSTNTDGIGEVNA